MAGLTSEGCGGPPELGTGVCSPGPEGRGVVRSTSGCTRPESRIDSRGEVASRRENKERKKKKNCARVRVGGIEWRALAGDV